MPETAMSSAASVGLVLDPVFTRHDPGPGHPEQVARYRAITEILTKSGLASRLKAISVREAEDEELALIHHPKYIDLAVKEISEGATQLSTGDTTVCKDSLMVARRAAGAVCEAVNAIMRGEVKRAFCAVRPPGHHATPSRGMGFCVFNNAALAARYAQQHEAIDRVAIVDWDVHHGNGTQDIFYEDPTVHFFSTHQWPLYPGTGPAKETGSGAGERSTMNRPFPAGSGMKEIGDAFKTDWTEAMETFKPQFVVISAGFDSRIDDPLGGFTLTDDDFAKLTRMVRQVADRHADGRVIACLEGGYNVNGLALAVQSHLQALLA
jgi:acetoin utilization deacetylase AcuC-like enzyme